MAIEPLLGTRAQKAFILTVALQAIAVLVMVAIVFRKVEDSGVGLTTPRYKTTPCYLALFALAEILELAMAFDALRLRNIIQLAGILIFHLSMIVFSTLQVSQTHTALVFNQDCDPSQSDYHTTCSGPGTLWNAVEPFLITAPCVIAAAWVAIFFWIKALYAEFGWAIFHVVGANPKMKTMYQWYQIFICLLKFDFIFFVGVTMQLLIVVLDDGSPEFGLTIAAIPVVLLLLAGCIMAVSREIKWLMSVSLALMLPAMGYFVFKIYRFYSPATEANYLSTRATLTIFTIIAFLLLFATFAVGLRCFADFDKGLRHSKVNDVPATRPKYGGSQLSTSNMNMQEVESNRQSSYIGGAQLQPRISIE